MAIHVGGVALPGPGDVLGAVRSVTGWGAETTKLLAELPTRASTLLAEFELVVRRLNDIADRTDRLVTRVDSIESEIVPVLGTLDQVGPDIHELLAVMTDLSEILRTVPGVNKDTGKAKGMSKLRRRCNRDEPRT